MPQQETGEIAEIGVQRAEGNQAEHGETHLAAEAGPQLVEVLQNPNAHGGCRDDQQYRSNKCSENEEEELIPAARAMVVRKHKTQLAALVQGSREE